MKKSKKLLIVIVVLLSAMSLYVGPEAYAQSKILDEYMMPEPQTWSFIKYGGQTPDLYTGTVRAEIPIYTYKDPEFEIPVFLSYSSNGYMPNVQANFVGLGWTLNCGGCITRRVRGIKDNGSQSIDNHSVLGYWKYVKDQVRLPLLERAIDGTQELAYFSEGDSFYETESDIYMFSFPGHSGKFVIGDSKNVIVYDTNGPSGEYKVILDEYDSSTNNSKITILTGDGYRYVFGGFDSTDNSFSHSFMKHDLDGNPVGGISADESSDDERSDSWYLVSITAPNGRIATYNYSAGIEYALENVGPYASRDRYSVDYDTGGRKHLRGHYSASASGGFVGYNIQKSYIPRLDSIEIDGGCVISFTYGNRCPEIGKMANVTRRLSTPKRLEAVSVTYHDGVSSIPHSLLHCALGYSYTHGNPVLLLKDVHVEGSGHYRMAYHSEDSEFPYQGTACMDHWGYYNSNPESSPTGLLPDVVLEDDYRETVQGNRRSPDASKSVYGMLESLYYPAGGYTEYEYEPHYYSRRVESSSSVNYGKPVLGTPSDSPTEAGGLRIRRIVDHASDGVESERTYSYTDGDLSSGIMLNYPRYSQVLFVAGAGLSYYKNIVSSSIPSYIMDQTYIEYSKVTETYGDGSCQTSYFSSYADTPDETEDIDEAVIDGTHGTIPHPSVIYPSHSGNLLKSYSSRYLMRGLLTRRETSDNHGDIVKVEEMTYVGDGGQYTGSVHFSTENAYILRNYLSDRSVATCRTAIDGSEVLVSNTYNDRHQLITRAIVGQDQRVHKTYMYYPQDAPLSNSTVERQMADSGRIAKPICVVETFGSDGLESIVSATNVRYKTLDTGTLRMFVKASEGKLVIPVSTPSPFTWYTVRSQARNLQIKTVLSYDVYNSLGRPCAVTDSNGIQSLLLWGYGGLYPVALVGNCTTSSFSSSGIGLTADLGWSGLTEGQRTALRSIPGASVTTWKYLPFVGVTEKRGPDGRKATYDYDDYGRLVSVKDTDADKVEEYHYNIITE